MKILLCAYGGANNTDLLTFGQSLSLHLRVETQLLGIAADRSQAHQLQASLTAVQTKLLEAGLPATVQVVEGPVESAIRTAASGDPPHLIVLGYLDRPRFLRYWLGPRAIDVLEHGQDSVLFVPPGAQPSIRRVLLAIGGLSYSQAAVEMGAHLARAYQAQITLLHVVQPKANVPEVLKAPVDVEHFLASDTVPARTFRQALTYLQTQEITTVPRLRQGEPLQQLLLEVQESAYELLVVGSHHTASTLTQILGGISPSLIRRTSIPVLVTRKQNR